MHAFEVIRFFRFGQDEYQPGDTLWLSDDELHFVYGFRLQKWIK